MTTSDGADDIDPDVAPSGPGCLACEQQGPPGWWFHLRRCAACGVVGCCDSSLGKHATAHYRETGHRYMRSYEPGEDWFYDFTDDEMLAGPPLAAPLAHPSDQPTPGPAGRVPADWQSQLEG